MTPRERFHQALAYGQLDRVPLWEEGIRDDVRAVWAEQGLLLTTRLDELFAFDHREETGIDLRPKPDFDDLSDAPEVFVRLRNHFQPDPSRLPSDWRARAQRWSRRDFPVGMSVWRGLFQSLGVEDWRTLTRALFALADVPSVMARTMGTLTDCAAQTVEYALTGVALDYAIFDETIAGAYGSVVSPSYFRRFCAPFYRRLVDILRMRGVRWFVVRTYGNPLVLLPSWIDCGINVLWCAESSYTGVDYARLRSEFGRQLRFIGGIDLREIAAGNGAIEKALNGSVARLLDDGGYLPMADGRIRKEISWRRFEFYRHRLQQLVHSMSSERSPE